MRLAALPRLALYVLCVALASAGGMVLEIAAGRLIAPYAGMSLYTWTAIIAVVLAGLSAGHWIGGLLASPGLGAKRGAIRLAGAFALAAISTGAALPLLRLVSQSILSGDAGSPLRIVALSAALFLLPSLFVGVVSPLAAALALEDTAAERRGRVLGLLYASGAFGGIAGTLSAGYLFISWIGSTGTVLAVAGSFAALAAILAIVAGRSKFHVSIAGLIAVGGSALLSLTGAFMPPCEIESDYYCLRIDARPLTGARNQATLVLDHLAHGTNDRDDPAWFENSYIHLIDELTKQRLGQRDDLSLLVIGGGAYTLPRAWRLDYPNARIAVAEIDPAVTRAAASRLWFDAQGIDVRHGDGRVVLQEFPRVPTFDVIFVDAVQDIAIPPHLVTREFAAEAAARLKPGGLFAINSLDRVGQPIFALALAKTLAHVFPAAEVWADARSISSAGRATYIVLGASEPSPWSGIRSRRGPSRAFVRWPPEELRQVMAGAAVPLLTDDYAPVERLLRGGIDLPASGSPK